MPGGGEEGGGGRTKLVIKESNPIDVLCQMFYLLGKVEQCLIIFLLHFDHKNIIFCFMWEKGGREGRRNENVHHTTTRRTTKVQKRRVILS